ncbi:MAG: hypothetical protein FWB88_07055, partial [Defluviitaleaceae bacterium]|nr:hypothetical protein [Defluviitaleaceae bacterium]
MMTNGSPCGISSGYYIACTLKSGGADGSNHTYPQFHHTEGCRNHSILKQAKPKAILSNYLRV